MTSRCSHPNPQQLEILNLESCANKDVTIYDPTTPITLAETMGAMMVSVVEAQAQAARATIDFVEGVGLKEGDESKARDLRTVQFRYKKLDENQVLQDFTLEIPLLGMVDIPVITLKKATFSFSYEVTETMEAQPQKSSDESTPARGSSTARLLPLTKTARIKGRFAKRPQATSTTQERRGSLEVTVEFEKAPMPIGIDRILDILELAASESGPVDSTEESGHP